MISIYIKVGINNIHNSKNNVNNNGINGNRNNTIMTILKNLLQSWISGCSSNIPLASDISF